MFQFVYSWSCLRIFLEQSKKRNALKIFKQTAFWTKRKKKKSILSKNKKKEIYHLIEQILSTLIYLSELRVTHGDIQPKTILLDNQGNFRLTDINFLTSGMCGF